MQIVPDASFIVWSIAPNDERERRRRAYVQEQAWRFAPVAPSHLAYELGNALRKDWLDLALPLRAQLHATLLSGVELQPLGPDLVPGLHQLCDQHGISFYDSAYLQIGQADGSRILLTQDQRLRSAAAKELGPDRALDAATFERRGLAGTLP